MLLRDLPDDVLFIVLAKAAHRPDNSIDNFGNALPLLAVCQRWRRLALPVVYAAAYYFYHDRPLNEYGRHIGRPITKRSYPREQTNVDLIASAGCVNVVKSVHIELSRAGDLFPGISAAAARLREVVAVWTCVEYLRVDRGLDIYDAPAETDQAMAKRLIGMFPGVRQLDVSGPRLCVNANDLYTMLAAGYAGQLRMYNGYSVPLPPGCLLERLERADVMYTSACDHHNPIIQPSRLQHLRLALLRAVCPWDIFTDDDGSGDRNVVFPNLKSLKFSTYGKGAEATMAHYPQLHFPQLESLELVYESNVRGLAQHVVFPTHMAKLALTAPETSFDVFCGIGFPTVEQLTITVGSGWSRVEGLGHVGRFLSRMHGCKQCLNVYYPTARLLTELVSCTRLTSVKVRSQIDVSLVLPFVTQLPFLRTLEFADIWIEELPADLTITPLDMHTRLEPLNASLQTLSLGFDRRSSEARDAVAVAKYLLMRLPSLIVLSVAGVRVKTLLDFAREYSRFYPHLKNAESVVRGHPQR